MFTQMISDASAQNNDDDIADLEADKQIVNINTARTSTTTDQELEEALVSAEIDQGFENNNDATKYKLRHQRTTVDSWLQRKSSFEKNVKTVPFTTKITFENLSLKLKSSGKTVVDNVSGTLNVGTVTAIMGPSGM